MQPYSLRRPASRADGMHSLMHLCVQCTHLLMWPSPPRPMHLCVQCTHLLMWPSPSRPMHLYVRCTRLLMWPPLPQAYAPVCTIHACTCIGVIYTCVHAVRAVCVPKHVKVRAVLEQGALGGAVKGLLADVDPSDNRSLSAALEEACRRVVGGGLGGWICGVAALQRKGRHVGTTAHACTHKHKRSIFKEANAKLRDHVCVYSRVGACVCMRASEHAPHVRMPFCH